MKLAVVVGLLLALQSGQVGLAQVSFTDMLYRVPREANALVMIDADKIRSSPVAQAEAKANVHRHMILPKEVDRAVLASNLDTATMQPISEVAIVSIKEEASMAKIADTRGGKLENLGEEAAVWLPNDSYLVSLGPKLLGIQYPADRQHASRWARNSRESRGLQFGTYLQGASKYPEAVGTDIILALELVDVVSADTVRQNLDNSEVLKGKEVNLEFLSQVLASIQGTTLGIRVTDKISGSLRVDFAKDPSMMADFAKPLILEKIGELGAAIDDLYDWTARVEGKTVFLSGTFTVDGLRKVLSIVEPPPLPVQEPSPGQQVKSPSERDPMAYPTYDHYKAVQTLITDLRKSSNSKNLGSSGQCAIWYERYAKKIDQLPILNVDPDLLDFTAEVAVSLRGLGGTYRQVGIQSAQYSSDPTGGWVGGYTGGWGGYGYGGGGFYRPGSYAVARTSGPSPQSTAKRLGRANASQVRSEKFQTLDEGMAKMRRSLTEKYGLEF